MPVPSLNPMTGELPLGRHHCTVDEFEASFLADTQFSSSTTRPTIWTHWELARDALAKAVPVLAAWVGGSFTSVKLDPSDMDIVFLIDGHAADQLPESSQERQLISVFSHGPRFHAPAGRLLDTYVLAWHSIPNPSDDAAGLGPGYYQARGHWDDFWSRKRTTPKGTTPIHADSVPRRGYLEVKLSDYPS